jgi:hypothetical protein
MNYKEIIMAQLKSHYFLKELWKVSALAGT